MCGVRCRGAASSGEWLSSAAASSAWRRPVLRRSTESRARRRRPVVWRSTCASSGLAATARATTRRRSSARSTLPPAAPCSSRRARGGAARCDDVVLDGVSVRDAYADGIDPDCCRRVRIANCDIESRDDALCLKASFALGHVRSTEDVLVTNCRMRSASNCFKLGSESTGDFRRIVVSNCVFDGPVPADAAARVAAEGGGLALETVDGGTVDGVMISNIVMTGVAVPLFVRLGNRGRDQRERRPGRLRNVSVNGLLATGATGTGSISGLRDSPVEGITLDNVRIIAAGGASARTLDVPEREDDYPTVSKF